MAVLPYVTAPGNVERALKGIRAAATPDSVSQDFVKTILGIKGGSGNQMTAYLKKIGLATADGTPTDVYKKLRNSATEGWAAAQALKIGYGPLFTRNEYMYKLSDEELKGLIIEETGAGEDSSSVPLALACIKHLKKLAKWDATAAESGVSQAETVERPTAVRGAQVSLAGFGLNLGYNINLNLPATSDPAVFNAIFRALKEHLLRSTDA
ncbi:MAG: DUF5343 domain-containing protein [Gemmatimonadetes bacterium]|nr:DUF5343 domain-containing protein [Gemmatimonadota bacterium]HBX79495.1 hypothetical protein [Acidimicrobiaceae bacterium]